MARYGFNGEKTEMKIFILFIMRHILDPVTLDQMGEMVMIDDNMNYFLYSQSVAELVESGMLLREPGKAGDTYTLTPHGYDTLAPVERTLPVSLRRAGQENARAVLNSLRRKARIHTEVLTRGDEPMARLTMTDGQDPILRIELVTGSVERSRAVCAHFEQRAEAVFDGILRILLENGKEDQSDAPSSARSGAE